MTDKPKGQPEKPAEDADLPGSGEWVPLQEGRYGASWFVMLAGLLLVILFFYSLLINNLLIIDAVTAPPKYGGPSDWAVQMSSWVYGNMLLMVYGSIIFMVGYSLTLKRKGGFRRDRLTLRLFGCCTGFVSLFVLVMGFLYIFVLPKEALVGWAVKLEFYGLQLANFLVCGGILGAITVYCWLKKEK